MKPKALLFLITVLLMNSCIVKSLFPFYTKDSIWFEPRLIGSWQDDKVGIGRDMVTRLEVYPFREKYLELQGDKPDELTKTKKGNMLELSGEYTDFGAFGAFEKGYFVIMTEDNKEAVFAAVPFKIKEETFLDFVLLDVDMSSINSMAANHMVGMHTLIKVEFNADKSRVNLKWFAEEKLDKLIDENRIRIKYANVGTMTDTPRYLLTAPPEELQKFIAKYMDSKDEDKWASDIEYNFKKS